MNILSHPDVLLAHAGYLLMYVGLFFLAKWTKGLMVSYKLDAQLTEYDNTAVSISFSGFILGITAIFAGAVAESPAAAAPSSSSLTEEFLAVAGYSLLGLALLHLSRLVNNRLILSRFSVEKELIHDQNPGTGIVEAASYLSSGLVIAGAIYGEGGGLLSALVFYAIGQVCLIAFGWLYQRLSPYDVHAEIEKDNTSAGVGFAGGLISIGIILMKAVSGTFKSWAEDLAEVGVDVLIVFIYLIGVRLVFDRLVLRNSNLQNEIVRDQNLGAGILEMVVSVSFSAVLFFLL